MEDRTIPRQMVSISLTLIDGHTATGELQIDLDARLSDFMNKDEQFIVLRDTNDSVRIVNKQHIIDVRTQ